jgi:hypothetical protein
MLKSRLMRVAMALAALSSLVLTSGAGIRWG